MKQMIISKCQDCFLTALIEANEKLLIDEKAHLIETYAYEAEPDIRLGNIYIGKVRTIVSNIRAAFVELEGQEMGYLALDDVNQHTVFTKRNADHAVSPGDELLVMINQEAVKKKQFHLTTRLSISGRYLVLVADGRQEVNISKKLKLTTAEKGELKKTLGLELLNTRYSLILRTNAVSSDRELINHELVTLKNKMDILLAGAEYRKPFVCLHREAPGWLSDIRDIHLLPEEKLTLVTDTPEVFALLEKETWCETRLYEDQNRPILKAYNLENKMRHALEKRVWMKSGAYLVIEPTEALTVIDVNTGKCVAGKNWDEVRKKINEEAAEEIARQIRLRNLTGMILIDFINIPGEQSKAKLMEKLRRLVKTDPVLVAVVDITALNLVELTRQKKKRPLHETPMRALLGEEMS